MSKSLYLILTLLPVFYSAIIGSAKIDLFPGYAFLHVVVLGLGSLMFIAGFSQGFVKLYPRQVEKTA